MAKQLEDFANREASADERNDWIIKNADYFTAFRTLGFTRERVEAKTLDDAREEAKIMLKANSSKPILIYAVHGQSSTYVEMVKP